MRDIYRKNLAMQKWYNNNIIIIEQNTRHYKHYPIIS